MRQKAFGYLNRQALEEYRNIRKAEKMAPEYCQLRIGNDISVSDSLSGEQVSADNQAAYRYFLSK